MQAILTIVTLISNSSQRPSQMGDKPSPVRSCAALSNLIQTPPGQSERSVFVKLRDGLRLGILNNFYASGMNAASNLEAGFTVYLCFDESANVELSVAGNLLPIGRNRGAHVGVSGFVQWLDRPAAFVRRAPPGAWVKKIKVNLSRDYISQTFGLPQKAFPAAACEHLAVSRWLPSHRLVNLAASLFDTRTMGDATLRLRDEIVALDILNEAIATVRSPMASTSGRADMILLNRACGVIEKKLADKLSVDAIARAVGTSAATLQRLFFNEFGSTLAKYVRDRRLDTARNLLEDGGTVSEAAACAGYPNPKNFSTAFKRHFGINPRRVRAGDRRLPSK